MSHDDQRVVQAAQFAMVKKGESPKSTLVSILIMFILMIQDVTFMQCGPLGQALPPRMEKAASQTSFHLVYDDAEFVRMDARTCGDISLTSSKEPLIALLNESLRRIGIIQ